MKEKVGYLSQAYNRNFSHDPSSERFIDRAALQLSNMNTSSKEKIQAYTGFNDTDRTKIGASSLSSNQFKN